jgi:hypothetical protein
MTHGLDNTKGTLTTEHAASSYGQPVLVRDGIAYGASDMIDGMCARDYACMYQLDIDYESEDAMHSFARA